MPMTKYNLVYDLEPVTEGFVARCTSNPMATAFGKTKDEAGDNLVTAIQEYLKLYPEKTSKILVTVPIREVEVGNCQIRDERVT